MIEDTRDDSGSPRWTRTAMARTPRTEPSSPFLARQHSDPSIGIAVDTVEKLFTVRARDQNVLVWVSGDLIL